MHRASLIVPRPPAGIRVAWGQCRRGINGVEVGVFGSSCYVGDISWVVWVWTRLANGGTGDGGRSGGGRVGGRGGGMGRGWVRFRLGFGLCQVRLGLG
jgi:hypothetical protein